MARLIARKDEVARYVYVRASDGFPVPTEAREILKRNGAEFSGETKEWRVHINRGPAVVTAIRAEGHTVVAVDGNAPPPPPTRGPLECRECGQPYRVGRTVVGGEPCAACGAELHLIEPPEAAA